jgi:hypothetical protein
LRQFDEMAVVVSAGQPIRDGQLPDFIEQTDILDGRRRMPGEDGHQFSEEELSALAAESGLDVAEMFYSDGEGGRLGLYQV